MTPAIVRRQGRYYIETTAQASRKRFLMPAGDTLKEARERLKELTSPARQRRWRLFDHYDTPVDEEAIWRQAAPHRSGEVRAFAASKRLAVQTDQPEAFLAADSGAANVLRRCGFAFDTLSTADVRRGALRGYDAAVFPGGFGYLPDRRTADRIREFVANGGGLLGICAGAFLPLRDSCGVRGACLGMLDATYVYFRERGLCLVAINPADPVARGIESSSRAPVYALYTRPRAAAKHTTYVSLMRGNGPLVIPGPRARSIGWYDGSERYAAFVRGVYGKGRIVVFSAHPDAFMESARMASPADAVQCIKLIKNAILYCGRV
ncbi:MAG TPA: hypothetical protein P5137_07770 [Candidatus Brocadiia bacterium]|nr:hypothetical protein [Candidatus Brocadiia bacterium]